MKAILVGSTPSPFHSGFDHGLHAANKFAMGVAQDLFNFDFGEYGTLGFEIGNRNRKVTQKA